MVTGPVVVYINLRKIRLDFCLSCFVIVVFAIEMTSIGRIGVLLFFVIWHGQVYSQSFVQLDTATQTSLKLRLRPLSPLDYLLIDDTDGNRIDSVSLAGCQQTCYQELSGLSPSTEYLVRLYSEETFIQLFRGLTSSESSGEISVFFTTTVDERVSTGSYADGLGGEVIESLLIDHINAARRSIDACFYNNNRRGIVAALNAARARGVVVRYITGDDTANTALYNPEPDFPVLMGNTGSPLMHHKFLIVDADMPEDCIVITGATNTTTNQIYKDHNNLVRIRDRSLAYIYTREFNEMWGTSGPEPDETASRFGSRKTDNTPHHLFIGGRRIEVYFSPSDNTTFHIINALNTAERDVYFALLTFTRANLAQTIVNLQNNDIYVRGLINNVNDTGSRFDFLRENGIFVLRHDQPPVLHHKYAIIDPSAPDSDPMVVTGSHNWSNAAENSNDENTLIIHDAAIANIYLQEFQARWCEVFPGEDCTLLISTARDYEAGAMQLFRILGNPGKGAAVLEAGDGFKGGFLVVCDAAGRVLQGATLPVMQAGERHTTDMRWYPPGQYFLHINSEGKRMTLPFILN